MVEKYARALGQLKEYEVEVETLDELLGQRFWRRGKRGSWCDRRALVEITYLSKVEGKKSKSRPKLKIAMEHLKDALRDEDTHLSEPLPGPHRVNMADHDLDSLSPRSLQTIAESREGTEGS